MEEQWAPIPGYAGYEASNLGRVRVLYVNGQWGRRRRRQPRVMKPWTTNNGYRQVRPMVNGKYIGSSVHRLVMLAFRGPCPENMAVCHGDGDRTNNRLDNLRYDTYAANYQDTRRMGRAREGKNSPRAKFSEEQIAELRRLRESGMSYPALAARFGTSVSHAHRIATRQVWKD